MVKSTITIILAGAAAFAVACSSGSAHDTEYQSVESGAAALFDDTRWALIELGAESVPSGADIGIEFDGTGNARGRAGVNNFFAQATGGPDGALTFGPIGSTRMAGSPEAMEREREFLSALEKTARFSMDSDHLDLLDERGGVLARFRRQQPLPQE